MAMEEDSLLPKSSYWISKLISLQADLIYNCLVFVFSPLRTLFLVASESYHKAEETRENVESAVQQVPSNTTLLLKRLGLGFLSAAYVCMVLAFVLILALVLGVCLVRLWVEEPVFVRHNLHFDYTHPNPTALFSFDGVPVGHTFYISLILHMPESDFNRDIGVFQLSAQVLSGNGKVIAKSSQPCMLRFRSFPIRLARTFILGVPILLGISSETQKISVEISKHKEDYRRTKAIKVSLCPRAGTSSLPQIYEAEIVMNSHLPWAKQLVHNWKWTFYVWVSLYIYLVLLMFLLCCWRPLIFPSTLQYFRDLHGTTSELEEAEESQILREGDENEVSELLTKWRRSRNKRKAILTQGQGQGGVLETIGSSASSISMSRQDITSTLVEDDTHVGDSESVCLG